MTDIWTFMIVHRLTELPGIPDLLAHQLSASPHKVWVEAAKYRDQSVVIKLLIRFVLASRPPFYRLGHLFGA